MMKEKILNVLRSEGMRGEIVSIRRLAELEESFETLCAQNLVRKDLFEASFSKFNFSPPAEIPASGAVLTVAIPQPISQIIFHYRGKTLAGVIPPTYSYFAWKDIERASGLLEKTLGAAGYRLVKASLPQKLLAVRAGLTEYGRNNVTYVPGEGSFFRLESFYTDFPCASDSWREPVMMEQCRDCRACLKKCPTGCITKERFTVRAHRCLTYFNESDKDFPEWIRGSWHNALVGCMICQYVCPANADALANVVIEESFSEEETGLLLEVSAERLPESTREKLVRLKMLDDWAELSRNLKALFAAQG